MGHPRILIQRLGGNVTLISRSQKTRHWPQPHQKPSLLWTKLSRHQVCTIYILRGPTFTSVDEAIFMKIDVFNNTAQDKLTMLKHFHRHKMDQIQFFFGFKKWRSPGCLAIGIFIKPLFFRYKPKVCIDLRSKSKSLLRNILMNDYEYIQ